MDKNLILPATGEVLIKLQQNHRNVLRGLLMRNPALTLSAIIAIALDPFCLANQEAADETEIQIELTTSERREKAPV